MPKSKSLSAFWREDSPDRVMELASIIQGANSILGVMGSDVAATWSTDKNSSTYWTRVKQGGRVQDMRVFLDYTPLAHIPAPFDPRNVDEVIGYAVHEGGHCIWTNPVTADSIPAMLNRSSSSRINGLLLPVASSMILRVDNIIEDAFIDFNVSKKWPVLGEYIHIARASIAARRPIDYTKIAQSEHPPYGHMVNLWLSVALYNYPMPSGASEPVKKALDFLIKNTVLAIGAKDDPAKRFLLAYACWEYLFLNFTDDATPLPRQAPKPPTPPTPTPPAPSPTPQSAPEGEDEEEEDEATNPEKAESEPEENEAGTPGETDDDDNEAGDDDEPEEEEEEDEPADTLAAGGISGDKGEDGAEGDKGEATPENTPDEKPEPLSIPGLDEGQSLGHLQGGAEEEPDPDQEMGDDSGAGDGIGHIGDLDDFDNREAKPVPDYLVAEVEEVFIHETEDLTKSVAEVLDVSPKLVMANTKKADYDAEAAKAVTSLVQQEILAVRRVFDKQAAVKSGTLTGKTSGRLDGRKVYRLFTGNPRIFKRREVFQKLDMAICLLADGSGSMRWRMDTVYQTCAVFAEALIHKQGVNFQALVYTGGMYWCETTRICDRSMPHLCLKNVSIGGGTPTATALASAKVLTDRMREGQKVIIHFTDGDPDDKVAVRTVVGKLRDAGYTVWGIAPKGYEADMLWQYGEGNYETIENIPDLPRKVAELVERLTK